jgi:hypothetical protein
MLVSSRFRDLTYTSNAGWHRRKCDDDGEKMNEENFSLAGIGSNGSRKRLDRWTNISHEWSPPTYARRREALRNGHIGA